MDRKTNKHAKKTKKQKQKNFSQKTNNVLYFLKEQIFPPAECDDGEPPVLKDDCSIKVCNNGYYVNYNSKHQTLNKSIL